MISSKSGKRRAPFIVRTSRRSCAAPTAPTIAGCSPRSSRPWNFARTTPPTSHSSGRSRFSSAISPVAFAPIPSRRTSRWRGSSGTTGARPCRNRCPGAPAGQPPHLRDEGSGQNRVYAEHGMNMIIPSPGSCRVKSANEFVAAIS